MSQATCPEQTECDPQALGKWWPTDSSSLPQSNTEMKEREIMAFGDK